MSLGLGTLTNHLLRDPRFRRAAVITSATTGNPALATIDLTLADSVLVLQYAEQSQSGGMTLADIAEEVALSHRDGTFDLAMIDPFHTYESSTECLALALNMLRPAGVLLIHDCLPPPEYTHPAFAPGDWCGTTFAAFRDLCVANGLRWFTVGNDFGIGVAVKGMDSVECRVPDDGWSEQTHEGYLARYAADPCEFMQAVSGEDARTALDLTLGGAEVSHLRMPFAGWPNLRQRLHETSDRSRAQMLEDNRGLRQELDSLTEHIRVLGNDLDAVKVQNRGLEEHVAHLQAQLVEASRPTWQARALLRSTPRAVRARVSQRFGRTD